MPELTCFRLLDAESPAGPLAEAVRQVNVGQINPTVFNLDPTSFQQIPNTPFAYWVEEKVRRLFTEQPLFESEGRTARLGDHPGDGFRYVRLWWEVAAYTLNDQWVPYQKGGAYSPYYSDIHLIVQWDKKNLTYKGFVGREGRGSIRPSNQEYFFRPGLTWSRRSQLGFSPRVLPEGVVFADKGPAAFWLNKIECAAGISLLSSSSIRHLLSFLISFGSYEVGALQRLPMVPITVSEKKELAKITADIWAEKRLYDSINEISHAFVVPWLAASADCLSQLEDDIFQAEQRLKCFVESKQAQVDSVAEKLYGFTVPATVQVETKVGTSDEDEDNEIRFDMARALVSYFVGVAFGRWAIPRNPEELRRPPADPFSPLPAQASGAALAEAAKLYFVEDASGESLLLNSCRVALRQVTGLVSADGYEQALADRLGVPALRDYLSRQAGFFADHLSVYTKSRRKAPIYWPLSTKSGNFTIWVYYPKLDDQSLPKLIADVLSPKIRTLSQEIENRRATPGGKIGELEALRQELEEMRTDFLDLINRGYRPNQNDGVLITACPLAKYFRHAGFRKNLEACWKELARGDYDWSHLAMAMWPDRVLEVCKKDRSIAIAHGKEELCPAAPAKGSRGRKKATD